MIAFVKRRFSLFENIRQYDQEHFQFGERAIFHRSTDFPFEVCGNYNADEKSRQDFGETIS